MGLLSTVAIAAEISKICATIKKKETARIVVTISWQTATVVQKTNVSEKHKTQNV